VFVRDSGIGIPTALQQTIFQEFYQIKQLPSSEKGLGLGLAIVKRLSELLQHPLQLFSAAGRGSTFTLTLPLGHWRVAAESMQNHPITSINLNTDIAMISYVLVIDDDDLVCNALSNLLKHWGYEVMTAHSGAVALSQLRTSEYVPAMIISDYHLQTETGLEVIRAVQTQLNRVIPSILITGDTTATSLEQLQASGYKWLQKPVKPAYLRKIMRHYLR
jgi:CheY-like chemotaxis protein